MVTWEVVTAASMLQFGALCMLTALLYAALMPDGTGWERLDAVRRDIERRREHG